METREVTRGGTTYTQNTANIGKAPKVAKERQKQAGGDKKSAKAKSVPANLPEAIKKGDARDKAAEAVGERIEIVNAAVEGKLLTERRLGDALAAMDLKQNRQANLKQSPKSHDVTSDVLADLGISKVQSHRWQKERVSVTPVCTTN
jgi:hypothetical protein